VARGARHGRPPLRESRPTKGGAESRFIGMQPPDWDGWGVGEHGPRVVRGLMAGGPFAVFIAKGMTAVKSLRLGPQRRFERDSGGSTITP